MKTFAASIFAATLAVTASAAQTGPDNPDPAAPSVFTLTGKVSEDGRGRFSETRRLEVREGDRRWTLIVPRDAQVRDATGRLVSIQEVRRGHEVRVAGQRVGEGTIEVDRIEASGPEQARHRDKRPGRDERR